MKSHLALAMILLFAPACASNDADEPAPGAGGGSSGEDGLYGSVVVTFAAPSDGNEGYASVLGRFFDGATPSAFPLELDTEMGDCRLLVPLLPFCSTPCTPDVCTADEVCTKYPAPLGVGALTIDGLGSALTLQAASSMQVYQSPSLPYPPCAEGSAVSASAEGIALETECIAPLELTGPDPIPVSAGQPVELSWVPAQSSTGSRIRVGLDISHHGGTKGEIQCDAPDTGSLVIPEPLVTKLVELGLAGYPTISVNRIAIATAADHPNVELLLSSGTIRAVDTGVSSCQEDIECADGQTCLPQRICG